MRKSVSKICDLRLQEFKENKWVKRNSKRSSTVTQLALGILDSFFWSCSLTQSYCQTIFPFSSMGMGTLIASPTPSCPRQLWLIRMANSHARGDRESTAMLHYPLQVLFLVLICCRLIVLTSSHLLPNKSDGNMYASYGYGGMGRISGTSTHLNRGVRVQCSSSSFACCLDVKLVVRRVARWVARRQYGRFNIATTIALGFIPISPPHAKIMVKYCINWM